MNMEHNVYLERIDKKLDEVLIHVQSLLISDATKGKDIEQLQDAVKTIHNDFKEIKETEGRIKEVEGKLAFISKIAYAAMTAAMFIIGEWMWGRFTL